MKRLSRLVRPALAVGLSGVLAVAAPLVAVAEEAAATDPNAGVAVASEKGTVYRLYGPATNEEGNYVAYVGEFTGIDGALRLYEVDSTLNGTRVTNATFVSSDEGVLTVSKDGRVLTGISEGKATISAYIDGDLVASIECTVIDESDSSEDESDQEVGGSYADSVDLVTTVLLFVPAEDAGAYDVACDNADAGLDPSRVYYTNATALTYDLAQGAGSFVVQAAFDEFTLFSEVDLSVSSSNEAVAKAGAASGTTASVDLVGVGTADLTIAYTYTSWRTGEKVTFTRPLSVTVIDSAGGDQGQTPDQGQEPAPDQSEGQTSTDTQTMTGGSGTTGDQAQGSAEQSTAAENTDPAGTATNALPPTGDVSLVPAAVSAGAGVAAIALGILKRRSK